MEKTKDLNQLDIFVADIIDVSAKSDLSSMEHPIFALSKKPDLKTFRYEHPTMDAWLEVVPSAQGRATIFDKDLLLYCIGQIVEAKNRGRSVSRRIRITAYEFFMTTGRGHGGDEYRRLHETLGRLRGTTIKTNITTKGDTVGLSKRGEVFGLIDDAKIAEDGGKTIGVEITLSEKLFSAISERHILTYSRDYFRLTSPNDRRMYEICRKHCGLQDMWQIGLKNLYLKFGSKSKLNEFRRMIKRLIEKQKVPDYVIKYQKTNNNEVISVIKDVNGDIKSLIKTKNG